MRSLALLIVCAGVAGCSAVGAFCEAAAECDNLEAQFPFGLDTVGEGNDSANVCVAEQVGALRALRANEEEGCHEEAELRERYMACVAQTYNGDSADACDGLTFQNDNPCDDELDDLIDKIGDNGDDCSQNEE